MQPRVSIATLIAVVGVLAVDCSIWRQECYMLLPPVDSTEPFIWTVIPLLSALAVGGLSLARQVVRRDEGRPFLLGFEAVGGVVVMALIASHWTRGGLVDAPLRATKDAVDHLLRGAGLIRTMGDYYTPFWHDFATPAIVGGIISMPPLLLALLGGGLFRKYEITIVRRRSESPAAHASP